MTLIHVLSINILEGGRVYGKLKSLKYKPSPIPSRGLEVSLLLKYESQDKWVTDAMEEFVENFYFFDFAGDLVVNRFRNIGHRKFK